MFPREIPDSKKEKTKEQKKIIEEQFGQLSLKEEEDYDGDMIEEGMDSDLSDEEMKPSTMPKQLMLSPVLKSADLRSMLRKLMKEELKGLKDVLKEPGKKLRKPWKNNRKPCKPWTKNWQQWLRIPIQVFPLSNFA